MIKKIDHERLMRLLGPDPLGFEPTTIIDAYEISGQSMVDSGGKTLDRCEVSGKVRFTSEGMANIAKKSRLRRGGDTSRLRVYRCEDCNCWHMSSSFHKR